MSKILMGIIAALGIASYFLYIQNENLKQDLLVAEVKFQETENKYNVMREDFEKQGRALQNLQRENNVIEQEKQRYLDIFARHNLERLATVKPGLIQNRFNDGTVAIFEEIENDTKIISNPSSNDSD
jgi:Fe-S cluster assembly scaffold protein SufB